MSSTSGTSRATIPRSIRRGRKPLKILPRHQTPRFAGAFLLIGCQHTARRSAQNQPADTAWVLSETTSPVDYSPLITAVIRSTSSVKDAPTTLAVRCRGLRTELLLRMAGTWPASRASEVQVDYQINDQPFVRLRWTVSADGKTAGYKDDAVGLLRSLPENDG
jgi:hypothetical protein